jgi:proline dehydrogenase
MDITGAVERFVAGRWIAGPEIQDSIKVAKRLNRAGLSVIINYLGEEIEDKAKIKKTIDVYKNLIEEMKTNRINGSISLKPSQIGSRINAAMLAENYSKILDLAEKEGIFVWLDMEQPETVAKTIHLYLDAMPRTNAGICIQAYLRRSGKDISSIANAGGAIRLVKGAYNPGIHGYSSRADVERNYRSLMHDLFIKANRFMIATHDRRLIREAIGLSKSYKKTIQYGMLNGIENKYAAELAKSGESVSLYLPFGTDWTEYSYRRLREGSHALLLAASLFRNQSV